MRHFQRRRLPNRNFDIVPCLSDIESLLRTFLLDQVYLSQSTNACPCSGAVEGCMDEALDCKDPGVWESCRDLRKSK